MRIYSLTNAVYFYELRKSLTKAMLEAPIYERVKWQQMVVEGSQNHRTHELRDVIVHIECPPLTSLDAQRYVQPDLPWAEDHFAERVGGEPINPGNAHAYWPYHGASMQEHLRNMGEKGEHYDHNYMERMWCRGLMMETLDIDRMVENVDTGDQFLEKTNPPFTGYRFNGGDLGSVVELLRKEPTTRQAFLPIWFPEDTGVTAGQRVPCTIGYYFQMTGDRLHMTYTLRACELYRHFTNDVYLAVRLQQWMANQLGVYLGEFTMQVANMHLFVGDEDRVRELFLQ